MIFHRNFEILKNFGFIIILQFMLYLDFTQNDRKMNVIHQISIMN